MPTVTLGRFQCEQSRDGLVRGREPGHPVKPGDVLRRLAFFQGRSAWLRDGTCARFPGLLHCSVPKYSLVLSMLVRRIGCSHSAVYCSQSRSISCPWVIPSRSASAAMASPTFGKTFGWSCQVRGLGLRPGFFRGVRSRNPLASPTSSTRRTSSTVVSFGRAFSPASLFESLIDSLRETLGVRDSHIDLAPRHHLRILHHRGQIEAIGEDFRESCPRDQRRFDYVDPCPA